MVFVRKLTDQQSEQAILLYQQGKTFTAIGELFGVNRNTIVRALQRGNILTDTVKEPLPFPEKTSIAYLAGLFDGEGSINIFKQAKKEDRVYPRYFLEISIINTHKGVLQWVLENFGGRLSIEQEPKRHHRTWRWRASSNEAYHVLLAMFPYLLVKKEQARVAIEFQERLLAFKACNRTHMTQEEIDWRESQKVKLSTMRYWKDKEDE